MVRIPVASATASRTQAFPLLPRRLPSDMMDSLCNARVLGLFLAGIRIRLCSVALVCVRSLIKDFKTDFQFKYIFLISLFLWSVAIGDSLFSSGSLYLVACEMSL